MRNDHRGERSVTPASIGGTLFFVGADPAFGTLYVDTRKFHMHLNKAHQKAGGKKTCDTSGKGILTI